MYFRHPTYSEHIQIIPLAHLMYIQITRQITRQVWLETDSQFLRK